MRGYPNAHRCIHRHTGGLEKKYVVAAKGMGIHRHTGGLEKNENGADEGYLIHRHTGGLESRVENP